MRGFSSRIPTPGITANPSSSLSSSSSINPLTSSTLTKSKKDSNSSHATSKLTRPTDIGGSLTGFSRPTAVKQKFTQLTKSSLSNLTSRIITRQFLTSSEKPKEDDAPTRREDDQMIIDETIDLVGSDDNVNKFGSDTAMSKENIAPAPSTQEAANSNATFDLCRRDGTFIKSPVRSAVNVGSVNSLPDTKDSHVMAPSMVSKSRDSLNSLGGCGRDQTRIIQLRKSGLDLLGSTLSLTKSPEWASEDMLDATAEVFNSTMVNNRLVEVTPCRPFMNISSDMDVNASQMLCMSQNNDNVTLMAQQRNDLAMEVDDCDAQVVMRVQEARTDPLKRYSFGLDITECTLDCSIDLCETFSSTIHQKGSPMEKQMSYDVDESLGILTPDQMKEFLDSSNTNHTNHLDLPLIPSHKMSPQSRIDQTPSPEELPLDPVGVKMEDTVMMQQSQQSQSLSVSQQEVSTTESDPKTEMTKSVTSKVSNSIITSITSITSLDTGYIGDGEMSRPASRGAADQKSPSKAPRNLIPANQPPPQAAIHRPRQDPMTDSDFFTESDADDIFHQREKQRRAQVIDGHLYGPELLQGANVNFQQPHQAHNHNQESDSCMESSGVFTDNENRGDDYLLNRIAENVHEHQVNDMSPDLSSDTITSSGTAYSQKKPQSSPTQHMDRPRDFINETSSSFCSGMDAKTTTTAEAVNLISSDSFGSTKSSQEGDNDVSASGGCVKKVTISASKKLSGSSRKTHKNEANLGLKKQEMSSKVVGAKKSLNGKWEPVMNKIAENKNFKKRFDNVKSKVTCGNVKKSAAVTKTPPSEDHSLISSESTGAISKNYAENSAGFKR